MSRTRPTRPRVRHPDAKEIDDGKCPEVQVWQASPPGPFDAWPTGEGGFEYGFTGVTNKSHISRKVIKGASHLGAPNYGLRHRLAARQAAIVGTPTSHLGFRCIKRRETQPPAEPDD